MPHAAAVSPAVTDDRNASQVESSSPAQNTPCACDPVNPARENVTGALPAERSRSPKARA